MNAQITIASALRANVPLLLEGHTGTGKTFTIMELANKEGKTLHVINVSGELTVDSILGQNTLMDGNVVWRDGVLTTAMKNGDWVLFDEMNTALPEVLTVINGVLDDSRSVTLPNDTNERVEAHKDFRFIGTQNPATGKYAGTARLNDALLNRMIKVEIGFMDGAREVEALKTHTKKMSDTSIRLLVDMANYTRSRNNFDDKISTRDLVKIIRLRDGGGLSIRDALSTVLMQKYSEDEYRLLYGRYNDKLREYERFSEGSGDDPLDHIRKEFDKLKEERQKINEEKRNLRTQVKRELLKNLLGTDTEDGTVSEIPKGL